MAFAKKKTAVVHCAGGSPLREGISRADLPQDCREILAAYPDGIAACTYGCLGGGSCASACRKGAISFGETGAAVIDDTVCVGCGLCVKACPQGIIALIPPDANIRPKCSNRDAAKAARSACDNACIGCRICEKNCPADAIHVIDNHAVIDRERCISCGMCAVKCPRGVIHDADGIFAEIG